MSEVAPHREKKKGFPAEDLDTAKAKVAGGTAAEKAEGNSCVVMF